MSTDTEWEKWGRQDPYFGVITADRFRSDRLNDDARAEFFASGEHHVEGVLQACRNYFELDVAHGRILDFGCGVGRLVVAFARQADEVVGVDISESMLAEAGRNCADRGLANVRLVRSDDQLSLVQGPFDLVHSAITLQHIEVARGRQLFRRLVELVRPGGVGALHLTYGKSSFPDSFGQPPAPAPPPAPAIAPTAHGPRPGLLRRLFGKPAVAAACVDSPPPPSALDSRGDPQMLMNPYNLSEIAFLMHEARVTKFNAEFTDHGGELGVFLFFRQP